METWIGIDLGTTAVKVIAVDGNGDILQVTSREYPLYSPEPEIAEQDPEEIWTGFTEALAEMVHRLKEAGLESTIRGIGFSSAMHSLIAVDSNGVSLTPVITWADTRCVDQVESLRASRLAETLHQRTGTPIHAMTPLTKIMWLRKNRSSIFEKTRYFISIKEFIWQRLTGSYVVDESIASATALWNLQTRDWDAAALAEAGITSNHLSRVVRALYCEGLANRKFSADSGLPLGTPLVVGASDGVLANLGVGALEPGVVALSLGTSGALRTTVQMQRPAPNSGSFCYSLAADLWVVGGPFNNAGLAFRWIREALSGALDESHHAHLSDEEILSWAELSPTGAEGVLFLPYLTGDRAPHWDSRVRGAFLGLSRTHGAPHLVRAVMEGILFCAYDVMNSLEIHPERIRVTGGLSKSALWMQILADVFGAIVEVAEAGEASGVGAALLAKLAGLDYPQEGMLSWLKDALPPKVLEGQVSAVYQPDRKRHVFYQKGYSLFKDLYPAVSSRANNLLQLADESREFRSH